jgi:hypothetical protein
MITEAEIWDCLRTNFRLAAEHCDDLAKLPAQGPTYQLLLGELSLIEGACRQAAHWREDAGGVTLPPGQPGAHGFEAVRLGETDSAGWLDVAHMMGEVHKRCGGWIRGRYPRELFQKMAQVMREMLRQLERRWEQPLRKVGANLPTALPAPHRDTIPVSMSGLVLPPGFKDRRAA